MCLLCCGKARQANFARNIQCRRLEIILGIAHIAFTVTHSWSQGAVMEKNLHMINTDILASNGQNKNGAAEPLLSWFVGHPDYFGRYL